MQVNPKFVAKKLNQLEKGFSMRIVSFRSGLVEILATFVSKIFLNLLCNLVFSRSLKVLMPFVVVFHPLKLL